MAVIKNSFIQAYRGQTYYYTVNTSNNTVSYYTAPTNAAYTNNTGSLIFTEQISSLPSTATTGSSTTITNANQNLINSYGPGFVKGVTKTTLYNIENNVDPTISQAVGAEAASSSTPRPEPDKTVTPEGTPPPGPIINPFDTAQEQNAENAQNIEITAATLPAVKSTLKYPIDLDTSVQDTLQISIFQYQAARGLPGIDTATDGDRFLRTQSFTSENISRQKLISIITLPIPNAVADSNAVSWGGGEFSSIAGQMGTALTDAIFSGLGPDNEKNFVERVTDAANTVGGALGGTIQGAGKILKNPYFQRKKILDILAKGAAALGVTVDVTQVITRVGGVVENPNLELLFTGPSLRAFTFQVRLTPRSIDESREIRQIIRAFKQHSAVKKGAQLRAGFDASNLLLGTPDVFVLKYIQAGTNLEIKGVTKMKTCALTNISVDYTGGVGRWAAYDGDSQPMTSIVTLNFAELAPIYDTDYNSFDVEDVGF